MHKLINMKISLRFFTLVLFLLSSFYTYAQTAPGGVTQNLNLWVNTDDQYMIKVPAGGYDYVYDLKFINDNSKALISPFASNSPRYYRSDADRYLNQYESISFQSDSGDHRMISSNQAIYSTPSTALHLFVVPSVDAVTTDKNPVFSTAFLPANTSHFEVSIAQNNRVSWQHGAQSDTFSVPMGSMEFGKPYLWRFTLDVANQKETIAKNGVALMTKNSASAPVVSASLYPILGYTGTTYTPDTHGSFDLGELLIYQGTLSAQDIRRIESYLAFKFGMPLLGTGGSQLSLLSSDPQTPMWDSLRGLGYDHHITGVGRDLAAGLIQKQNRHAYDADQGSAIAMGLGSIDTTNTLNTYTFPNAADQVFYTWGDNGLALDALTTDDIHPSVSDSVCAKRVPREWQVLRSYNDTTADRPMELRIDLSAHPEIASQSLSSLRLMIDEDGNGDFADGSTRVIAPTSIDAGELTFGSMLWDVDRSGGDVFTLLFDYDQARPSVMLRDTVFGFVEDSLSIYEAFESIDTATYLYLFTDSDGLEFHSSDLGDILISANREVWVQAVEKGDSCSSVEQSAYFVFRDIVSGYKSVQDSTLDDQVAEGEPLTYTLFLYNIDSISRATIDTLEILDPIPQHTTYIAGSATAPGQLLQDTLVWQYTNLGLAYGDTLELSFSVRAADDLSQVVAISNLAHFHAQDPKSQRQQGGTLGCDDPSDPNCVSTGSTIINVAETESDLAMTKSVVSTSAVEVGKDIKYKLEVENLGPAEALDVVVIDTLPAEVELLYYEPASADVVYDTAHHRLQWSVDILALGSTSLSYTARIIEDGDLRNVAQVYALNHDPNPANNIAELITKAGAVPVVFTDLPNTITPNGDGLNDYFVIPGLENYPYSKIEIYNRWGSPLYKSDDYQNDWNGEGLLAGTYYYILHINTSPVQTVKGWIQILK